MATKQAKARSKFAEDFSHLVMQFGGKNEKGEFVAKGDPLTFEPHRVPGMTQAKWNELVAGSPTIAQLVLHGAKQKMSDGFADPKRNPRETATTTRDNLYAGTWATKGEGGGGGSSDYVTALAEMFKLDPEEAKKRWAAKTDEEKNKLKASAKVQAAVETIRERRAKEKKAALQAAAKGEKEEVSF